MSKAQHFGLLRIVSMCSSIILFSESFSQVKTSRIKHQFYLIILLFLFKDSKCTKFGFSLLVFYVYHFLFNGFELFISFFKNFSFTMYFHLYTHLCTFSFISMSLGILYFYFRNDFFSTSFLARHFFFFFLYYIYFISLNFKLEIPVFFIFDQLIYCIFQTIRCTPHPQIWKERGGASYSLNVAYLAHLGGWRWWSGVFPLFSSSKTQVRVMVWCVLQSEKYGN